MIAALIALASLYAVDPASSTLRYAVVHKLHRVDAVSTQVEGRAAVRDDSVIAQVRAPISSFHSGDGNRDEHMDEVLDAATWPSVTLKGMARLAQQAGPLRLTAEVDLHGVKRPYEIEVQMTPQPDGSLRVRGGFDVSLTAHGIERPSLFFVKIDDACHIQVDLTLRPEKP